MDLPDMPAPPGAPPGPYKAVRCDNCGAFAAGFGISDVGFSLYKFIVDCGKCGHRTHAIPEGGKYEVVEIDGRLQAVFFQMTPEELKQLHRSVREAAQRGGATVADVVGVVDHVAPTLAEWVREWIGDRQARMEVVAVAALILAVVQLALSMVKHDPAPPATVINQVVVDVEQGRLDQLPFPRHKPCFCGSGKRYNQCHASKDAKFKLRDRPPG